jgi:hypothetical protein
MKKLLSLCLLLLTTIAGWAQDPEPTTFTVGNFKYTVTDAENNYVSVVKADEFSFSEDLVIPSSVTYETVTYAVTAVGYEGFIGTGITSVTIPASVMSVGNHAFYDCDGLTAITIEDGETALQWLGTDWHPLHGVDSNYTLYLGRDLTTEYNMCFFPGATSVVIGDQVTSVNPHLFEGATKLANVTMGSGVTTIGASAFQNTGTDESVTAQSISLGANVTTIGDYAFYNCSKLTTLDLGRKLTAIPENMLFGCSALTGITIPASVQSVGAHAFYDCDGLTTITIEDSGIGIAPDLLSHVFDRFVRDEQGRHCGTGLVLPIVKELVEQMDGIIDISSELGKGTTVWVTIPCHLKQMDKKREIMAQGLP